MSDPEFEFPAVVRDLPEIDITLPGVRGWPLQGESKQVVFFDIEPVGVIPEHAHGAQFGVVLDGEMSLTIGGETRRYGRGDSYFIPAGAPHRAVFHSRFRAIDVFDEAARYRSKR